MEWAALTLEALFGVDGTGEREREKEIDEEEKGCHVFPEGLGRGRSVQEGGVGKGGVGEGRKGEGDGEEGGKGSIGGE